MKRDMVVEGLAIHLQNGHDGGELGAFIRWATHLWNRGGISGRKGCSQMGMRVP
jgi:hypothetical protein